MKPLQLFTNPECLRVVHANVLRCFLEDMKQYLPPEAAVFLGRDLSHHEFSLGLAKLFSSLKGFGAPLVQALCDIDTLALPENTALLEDAVTHAPPNFVDTTKHPLNQSLHLWLIAQANYGFTFPISTPPPSQPGPPTPPAAPEPSPTTPSLQDSNTSPVSPSRHDSFTPFLASPPSSCSPPSFSSSDFQQILERLASLSTLDYDLARQSTAARLGTRLETLDAEVARCRAHLSNGANGTAVILPPLEPWPEPVNGCELLHEVKARFTLRLALPPGGAVALTLWSAHPHALDAFRLSPRLNLTSPKHGCGKTTTLDIIACLVPRPLRTENLTPPVLFRLVDQFQPTLLLDEVDSYIHQNEELRGLLNAGHKPSARACRCKGENNGVRAYKAFAPAALAGIGSLPGTLLDRSVSIPLLPAKPGEIAEHFDPQNTQIENVLARKLARWTQDNFLALKTCEPVLPPAAFNRLGDNWRPLFAIAQVAGGDWPALALNAFTCLTKERLADPDDPALALLADIRTVFAQAHLPSMSSKQLVAELLALPQRPWAALVNGHTIDETWLATRLRTFDIRSHNIRFADRRAKGYALTDFTPTFAQFLKVQPVTDPLTVPPNFEL